MKTYCLLKVHLVLLFSREMIKKCANAVIDACYEPAAQRLNTDLFSSGISYKGIIVEEEIVSGDHDVGEGEQRYSDQLLSSHFYQTKEECNRYEEDNDDLKSPEQQGITHRPQSEVEKSTVNIVITKSSQQQHFIKLEKQHKKLFLVGFYDPVIDYLELISSVNIKIFLSDDSCFCHPLKLHGCMLGFHLFLGSRSRISSVDQILTWLHWKHDVT